MKIKPLYCCEICGKSYHTVREALACENGHRMGNMWCHCDFPLFVFKKEDGGKVALMCARCKQKVFKIC